MQLSVVTSTSTQPISLAEAKTQCRLVDASVTEFDALLTLAIAAAVQGAERATGRSIITKTFRETGRFPIERRIELAKYPLIDIVSVSYRDPLGVVQAWPSSGHYYVEAPTDPLGPRGSLWLMPGLSWPTTYGQEDDVTIDYRAGYGATADTVPPLLKMALLMDVATFFADPERLIKGTIVEEVPGGTRDIYAAFTQPPTQDQRRRP